MKIDVTFPLKFKYETTIPKDHGYLLYSSICEIIPELHSSNISLIKLIRGKHSKNIVSLNNTSNIGIRIDEEHMGLLIKLINKEIRINNSFIKLGIPIGNTLKNSNCLYVPWTIINLSKNNIESSFEKAFLKSLKYKLSENINVELKRKRAHVVKGKKMLGYDLFLTNLTDEQSIQLQSNGIGHRRSMGCGIPEVPKRHLSQL